MLPANVTTKRYQQMLPANVTNKRYQHMLTTTLVKETSSTNSRKMKKVLDKFILLMNSFINVLITIPIRLLLLNYLQRFVLC